MHAEKTLIAAGIGLGVIFFFGLVTSFSGFYNLVFRNPYSSHPEAFAMLSAGLAMVLYAILGFFHLSFPRNPFLVVLRLLLTVGASGFAGLLGWAGIGYLLTSHEGECGLPFLAATGFVVFAALIATTELLCWFCWWMYRKEPTASESVDAAVR
jgi:hypothetical protein